MTDFPIIDEDVVLLNSGDTARKGMYVEFGLFNHPDGAIQPGACNPFNELPQGREKGQRFRVTIHLLADDETTTADTEKNIPDEEACPDCAGKGRTILDLTADPPTVGVCDKCKGTGRAETKKIPASHRVKQPSEATAERVKGGPLSQQAGRLCKSNDFIAWLFTNEKAKGWLYGDLKDVPYLSAAEEIVRRLCGCEKSRAELDHNDRAAVIWSKLANAYYAAQQGRTDEDQQRQREEGRT